MIRPPPRPTLFPYTTLFRSVERIDLRFLLLAALTIIVSSRVSVKIPRRSEEHTSELQSHSDLVCRLLLEKKKDEKWFLENEKTVTQFCRKLAAERTLKDIRD